MMRKNATKCGVSMALCNDNMWGYSTDLIVTHKVRWIEAAAVLPCWTSMIVYYVEESYGHLLEEQVGKQQCRTAVHGNCWSVQMPWEHIVDSLNRTIADHDLSELPRTPEQLNLSTCCACTCAWEATTFTSI